MKSNKRNQIRLLALSDDGKENVQGVSEIPTWDSLEKIWVTKEETQKLKIYNQDVCYIVDPFDDEVVPHIVRLGYSVIGPQCALTLAKHNIKLTSEMEYPVANLTMRGLLVCFSNVVKAKRVELIRLTRLMGGLVTSELTSATTHLVINEVGSVKYFKAREMEIPAMKTDWIEYLWTNGQNKYICAKDAKWENFCCPILAGCAICVTGFEAEQRKKIARDVESNGGSYSGAMKLNVVTHLICAKPEGQKYMYAKEYGAKLVDLSWLYESIEKGWCQDSHNYPVKKTRSSSTTQVKASSPKAVAMTSVSDIAGQAGNISSINITQVNETVNITMETASHTFLQPKHPSSKSSEVLNQLTSVDNKVGLELFDGITVYLVGFSSKENDKLTKLLSQNGATKSGNLASTVTHVIVGEVKSLPKDTLSSLRTAAENAELSVVGVSWVVKSLEDEHIASESDHWITEVADCPFEQPHHEQSTKLKVPEESTTFHLNLKPDHDELLSQYTNPADETYFANKISPNKCFHHKKFCLLGFNDAHKEYYSKEIKDHGGTVVSQQHEADFKVASLITKQFGTLSNFWLELCLKDNKLHAGGDHLLFPTISNVNKTSQVSGKEVFVEGLNDLEVKFIALLLDAAGSSFTENKFTASFMIQRVNKPTMNKFDGKILTLQSFLNEIWRVGSPAMDTELADMNSKISRIKQNMEKRKQARAAETKKEMKNFQTPMSLRRQRHRKIMEDFDTPRTVFQPGYKPKMTFDIDVILKHLQTPAHKAEALRKSLANKENKNLDEFDLEEAFEFLETPKTEREKLMKTLHVDEPHKVQDTETKLEDSEIIKKIDFDETDFSPVNEAPGEHHNHILEDVVVFISKKLSQDVIQELNLQAKKIGATIIHQYENTCTHFISEGKITSRECKRAKSDDKFIVSPHWLDACEEKQIKVDERLYSPTYNPDKSIQCETRSQDTSSNESSQKARDEFKKTVENLISNPKNTPMELVRRLSSRQSTSTTTPNTARQNTSKTVDSKPSKVPFSQDIQVGWDDPTSREEMARLQKAENGDLVEEEEEDISLVVKQGETPKFMFSGISEGKQDYIDIVKSLGGEVLESNCFDNRCTHLILQVPDRREKFLSAIARGTWNLHTSYFEACKEAKRFVKEEPYEYGDPRLTDTLLLQTKLKEHSHLLMEASRRWRLKLQEEKLTNEKWGAFVGWNVLMLLDKTFSQAFARIIRNGNGHVAGMSWPYSGDVSQLTHAIVDSNSQKDCGSALDSSGVHVCERQYISDFLIQEHVPSPSKSNKRESDDQIDSKNPSKKIRSK